MEELTIGNIKFRTFDLGGHTVARKVWSEYFQQVDAVVYMVDTVDRERFLESKAELDVRLLAAPTANPLAAHVLQDRQKLCCGMLLTRGVCLQGLLGTQGLTDVPFLILANKIDVPQAASEEEVRGALGLHNMTTGKGTVPVSNGVRPIEIFCCSVVKRMGYKEGFQWLSQYIS